MSDELQLPFDTAQFRRLMGETGIQLLTARGFTPSRVQHMHSTWFDSDGNKRTKGGVGPIELYRITTEHTTAVFMFRPEDMTLDFDLRDHQ